MRWLPVFDEETRRPMVSQLSAATHMQCPFFLRKIKKKNDKFSILNTNVIKVIVTEGIGILVR